jgi:site-specific DNA-methyltransferase (adenine-specific)
MSNAARANKLYFGDNLDILREYVADESIDLIYLDPPFNSQVQYNLLFERQDEEKSSAQAGAFRDTWHWGDEAEWSYRELMKIGRGPARFIDALRSALHESDMMAYLVMMAVRLHELHRKLKRTGSLYLHCDPTASHYLKLLLDGVFGAENFRNEIIWKRTGSHNSAQRFGPVHDVILYYTGGSGATWNGLRQEYDESYKKKFGKIDPGTGEKFQDVALSGPGTRQGPSGQSWRGFDPTTIGRHWQPASYLYDKYTRITGKDLAGFDFLARLDELDRVGLIYFSKSGQPRYKQFLSDAPGLQLQDVWTDIDAINSQAQERIGYPTQKPIALLDRIIRASSNPGDIVLDPFCGCGTTIEAAESTGRQWIGIDVAVHAIKVIEARLGKLEETTGKKVALDSEGMPRDFASALRLAEKDKYQFQWWANYLFDPHALREQKKGADRGVDGELFFPNGPGRPWGRMLTSVKGGEQVGPSMVRDFGRVLEREQAQLGLFICLHPPTREMTREAASVGLADVVHGDIPRLQIVAIEEWFKGKMPRLPPLEHLPSAAFSGRRRPTTTAKRADAEQPELPFSFKGGKADQSVVRHFNPRMVKNAAG